MLDAKDDVLPDPADPGTGSDSDTDRAGGVLEEAEADEPCLCPATFAGRAMPVSFTQSESGFSTVSEGR